MEAFVSSNLERISEQLSDEYSVCATYLPPPIPLSESLLTDDGQHESQEDHKGQNGIGFREQCESEEDYAESVLYKRLLPGERYDERSESKFNPKSAFEATNIGDVEALADDCLDTPRIGFSGSNGVKCCLPDVGDVVFGFRLLRELGHGAFARVFLA